MGSNERLNSKTPSPPPLLSSWTDCLHYKHHQVQAAASETILLRRHHQPSTSSHHRCITRRCHWPSKRAYKLGTDIAVALLQLQFADSDKHPPQVYYAQLELVRPSNTTNIVTTAVGSRIELGSNIIIHGLKKTRPTREQSHGWCL